MLVSCFLPWPAASLRRNKNIVYLRTFAVCGRRSHKMKQTQNTRVVSGGRRGGGVLAGERKGSGSHSGEWRAREKATAVTCTWTASGQEKKPEPLLSRSSCLQLAGRPRCLDSLRGVRAQKITCVLTINNLLYSA